jgi:ribosomal protein L7Ae-like RNA K-turn-binding protein
MDARTPESRVAGLLGLGVRGRGVVVGVEQVRNAAKRNKLIFALVAPDASHHSRDKLIPLLEARRIAWGELLGAQALGAAVGREAVAAIGVVDAGLAKGIRQVMDGTRGEGRDAR